MAKGDFPSARLLGFASSPIPLAQSSCSFAGAVSDMRCSRITAAKRQSRARIFALGATPPPPPQEPEDESGESEAASPAEDQSIEEVTADDILNSPSFLKKKLEIVQKELIEAKAKLEDDTEAVKEEKDRYVRLTADFENFRRRSFADLRKQDAKSTAKVCKEILTVLDNFERASTAVTAETDQEKAIVSSYQAINRQLLDALIKLKVEPIDAVGQTFDPEFHEAIQKAGSEEYKEDVICQQFQRGYKIEEVLIRPAIVAVSEGPGPEDDGEEEEDDSDVLDVESTNAEGNGGAETAEAEAEGSTAQ